MRGEESREEAMRVHLGGHLNWYDQDKRSWLELDPQAVQAGSRDGLSDPLTPAALAQRLGLPRGEIALVAVNGRAVDLDSVELARSDRVEFYPPVGGG
jgi:sulfur carrier protein ThiS